MGDSISLSLTLLGRITWLNFYVLEFITSESWFFDQLRTDNNKIKN